MTLPKLKPEQLKKIMLSAAGFVFLLYVYFTYFLGPLNKSRQAALENTEPLLFINKLSIHFSSERPQFQQVTLAASTGIEKR
jgi:hypothetical protein